MGRTPRGHGTNVGATAPSPGAALPASSQRSLDCQRSITEIRRQGTLSAEQERQWLSALQNLIPDVQDGDRLVGLWQPDRGMTLFFNGRSRGSLSDLTLSQRFMGIWLSAKTSEPELRRALLGGGTD